VLDAAVGAGWSETTYNADNIVAGALAFSGPGNSRSSYPAQGHFTMGGIEERIESTLPPVLRPNTVPRS
jgi:hypothetical protein